MSKKTKSKSKSKKIVTINYEILVGYDGWSGSLDDRIEKVGGESNLLGTGTSLTSGERDLVFGFSTRKKAFAVAARIRKLRTHKNRLTAFVIRSF
jgi:hypothetical protein